MGQSCGYGLKFGERMSEREESNGFHWHEMNAPAMEEEASLNFVKGYV